MATHPVARPSGMPAYSASTRAAALRSADAERLRRYALYLDFYNGKQWSRQRPNRTNLVVNYARTVVDKGVSYLLGRGVEFDVLPGDRAWGIGDGSPHSPLPIPHPSTAAVELIRQVYEENDLEAVDAQGAINGGVLGDTVFKVFLEKGEDGRVKGEAGRIRVASIDPFTFFPRWAADDPSTLLSVEVAYQLPVEEVLLRYGDGETGRQGDGGMRSVLPVSPSPTLPVTDVVEQWTDGEFALLVGDREVTRGPNPYGFIPFVHIPNVRPANEFWGVSDLRDVIPLNRELNERMSDMADVIRFHSDPPVIFKGVREHGTLPVGPGTVWDLPEGAEVELLEWRGQTPSVQEHVERVMRALHDVAETPKTAFGDSGRILSGVALETELQPLIQKTLRKRIWWSAGLRRRNRYILRIAELMGLGTFAPYRTRVVWPELLGEERSVKGEG